MSTRMYLMAMAGFGGMLLLAATSQAQPGSAPPGAPPSQPPAQPTTRPAIAVFNMAAVMKDYTKAKYQVYLLNEERRKLSVDLIELRGRYTKLQQDVQASQDPKTKEALVQQQRELARQLEDRDRDINKALNEKASAIISTLYDEIKTVVDKTAEMNGYHIVFAYPDATTPDEAKTPYVKELKLKPPAAQPFYVARHVDITGVVIQTLNTWYPSAAPPVNAPAGPPPGPTPAPPGPGPMPR